MKNRICPTENLLSEYISGVLPFKTALLIERHLASCAKCRLLISETHSVAKQSDPLKALSLLRACICRNFCLIGAVFSLGASFIFHKYFMQFLIVTLLLGTKWITASKAVQTFITIYKTQKNENTHTKNNRPF
ncbi:MAG: zf-HC2 domain-containing protein [Candidatus Omnitrophota bacterium]